MTQKGILSYFNKVSNPKVPVNSPVARKQTAIRTLKKFKLDDDDLDFELSSEQDDDDKEFQKAVTEEKTMKSQFTSKSPKRAPISRARAPKKGAAVSAVIDSDEAAKLAECSSLDESSLPSWLSTDLRDAAKRRPSDPDYDKTTVYIPSSEEEKFTPFQKQFWEIKRTNFDTIVMIRKGKFYEMFNVDAIFARDSLKLRLTFRGKEPMCGIPEKAFSEWALKIINLGRRVCKVEQTETAIDQKNRKGGDKAIHRELVQIYSLGTIDDFEMLESSQPSYLMAIRSSERSKAGVVLVDCSVGSFHMGVLNEEDLADSLIRFEPVEVIYHAGCICEDHLSVVKNLCTASLTKSKSGPECWDSQLSMNSILRIAGWDNPPQILESFPPEAIAALGGCVAYLDDNKIAKSILSLQRFSTLDKAGGSRFLGLDSSALTNLQIVTKDDKNLLSILDNCSTAFGKRKFRFWVMHPLRSEVAINERLDCVEELMESAQSLSKELRPLPDLERILSRVYSNRCSVRNFLDCLSALKKVAEISKKLEAKVNDSHLKTLFPSGKAQSLAQQLNEFEKEMEVEKSLEANEFIVKNGVFEDIDAVEEEIKSIDTELNDELSKIKKELKCREIEFIHQQSQRYQVQIPISYCDDLDSRFSLMTQTKTCKRYHTPEIEELVNKLETVENERMKLRSGCQKRFIDSFSEKSVIWDSAIEAIAEFDCLLSLTIASQKWNGDKCRPKFVEGKQLLSLKAMRHPMVQGDCIPNDVLIGDKNVLVITGPNASGKSTFARMCCTAIILAQLGCYLPAEEATLTIYDQIFTRIGAGDRLFNGQSTFAVELAETARLMKFATKSSFVVLDELGRGTSTFDGIAIATAVLEYFIENIQCPLVFCTHYHILTQQFQNYPNVSNVSMAYLVGKTLTLLYKLVQKPCPSSFGCAVAKMCGIPDEITEDAQRVANEFEQKHKALHVVGSDNQVEVKELKPGLVDMTEKFRSAAISGTVMEKYQKLSSLLFVTLPAFKDD